MPLYREDFDALGPCDHPGCRKTSRDDEIFLHGRCHRSSPVWVSYRGDVLTGRCAQCGKRVFSVVIAARESEDTP